MSAAGLAGQGCRASCFPLGKHHHVLIADIPPILIHPSLSVRKQGGGDKVLEAGGQIAKTDEARRRVPGLKPLQEADVVKVRTLAVAWGARTKLLVDEKMEGRGGP